MDEFTIQLVLVRFKSVLLLCLLTSLLNAQTAKDPFQKLINDFEKEYIPLNIPALELSYVNNLKNINSLEELREQKRFFLKNKKLLEQLSTQNLSEEERVVCQVLTYEIDLNLSRIHLEYKWLAGGYSIKGTRIYDEPLGKDWYAYFLKKWIDKDLTPAAAYKFGLKETEHVKLAMAAIQKRMGMDDESFKKHLEDNTHFLSNNDEILEKYNALKLKVKHKAKHYFPDMDKVPLVHIQKGTNPELAIVPAYYNRNTFYYNYFDHSYDSRDMGWLFLHEAIPGHHYQRHLSAQQDMPISNLFRYMSYIEGWGAYIEQYGNELGAYNSPMDAYAQLQWDLIRSVRVVLDVALNYYGWSDEQAMKFWNEHIADKQDIAKREIKRMKRWPAQVITYKYGRHILDKLKGDKNEPEELKKFHRQVLEYGAIPLSVLQNTIQKNSTNL